MDDKSLLSLSVPLGASGVARLFAWLAMALGAVQLVNGLAAFVLVHLVDAGVAARLRGILHGLDAPAAPAWLLAAQAQALAHLPELALAQVALALLTLLAAIGLLRGRRWAQLYFVAWLALVALASVAWLARQVAEQVPVQPAPAGWLDTVTAWTRAYADMLLVQRSAVQPTVVLLVSLCLIAAIGSPRALVRRPLSAA